MKQDFTNFKNAYLASVLNGIPYQVHLLNTSNIILIDENLLDISQIL